MPKKRNFKLIGRYTGKYTGSSPLQAARKAFSKLSKSTSGQIKFGIQECTRGSKCKRFFYVGSRQKLKTPRIVQIGGRSITYKYKNKVYRDTTCEECNEYSEGSSENSEESSEESSESSESSEGSEGDEY